MTNPHLTKPAPDVLDVELNRQLEAIAKEDVPDRLLDLARQLQVHLRKPSGQD
ncbi:hypothetical protein [Salipiger marinus]|jgi:hypothetical protein|uniref:Anti-sigma factor NepR domain-containing protein n=1 Tax=Salipiger marinus TaxID=555512 RepID=A0A1G8KFA8_9RHOB|nr:hypothetical protein [Salipiger marinus]SDI42058.1 hypothetical protein SAMN04487993_1004219 [Salipiger marinus]